VVGRLDRPVRSIHHTSIHVPALEHGGDPARDGGGTGAGEGVEVPGTVVVGRLDRPVRSDPPHLHHVAALGDGGDPSRRGPHCRARRADSSPKPNPVRSKPR